MVGAPAPAVAASTQDIVVSTTPCSRDGLRYDLIPFTVTTLGGATIPAGTVFTVDYAGGSTTPTWSGTLADNSTAVLSPVNDTSLSGGRYGGIKFTLKNPMPADTVWTLTIRMDIGALITGQNTRLSLTSSLPEQNRLTTNDSARHDMYFGGCAS